MNHFDLIIRGGTVATASDTFRADVGIRGGTITALGTQLGDADRIIDASGKLVLPGGIDAHCHLDQPRAKGLASGGALMADDFHSGSLSAVFGGTTTIIPFAVQHRGQSVVAAVEDYHRRANGKAYVDYGFHLIVSDPTPQVLQEELPALIADGYASVKVYMTYEAMRLSDRQILDVLDVNQRAGALTMIHAENYECIAWLTERLEAEGKTAPRFHEDSRPMVVEREATHRAITLSEVAEANLLIVHVSGKDAIEEIRRARTRGVKIFAETCPQYLFLSTRDLALPDFLGAKCMCSPPPRDPVNQAHVWQGVEDGLFDIFSSDHAPYRFDDSGKLMYGPKISFSKVANGIPGLETRAPLLFSEGVMTGRLDLNRFVALNSTNAAKLYGLHPQKGTIAVGADADIAIWDPERQVTITNAMLHHNVDYTPYEGRVLTGWPVTVLSRGQVICHEGELVGQAGHGRFLKRFRPAKGAKTWT
ncbi:dihydropyrimidinase [Rhodoferax koreense]|uniref:Dihydropyrimidinase n=1 Tax=Rhodoferax koreensis TaxID=1842727 RepID=A0A1P8JR41_9BURK|nr:dihydropyrimidinase [Rhodoferax koreense]APW36223.1 dihydropyrimidinase [Rhodoferax koreense]